MVIHDLNVAACYADRLMMLKSGHPVMFAIPDDLIVKERIREVYEMETKMFRNPDAGLIATSLWTTKEFTV